MQSFNSLVSNFKGNNYIKIKSINKIYNRDSIKRNYNNVFTNKWTFRDLKYMNNLTAYNELLLSLSLLYYYYYYFILMLLKFDVHLFLDEALDSEILSINEILFQK